MKVNDSTDNIATQTHVICCDVYCPQCQYNLRSLKGNTITCPECGTIWDLTQKGFWRQAAFFASGWARLPTFSSTTSFLLALMSIGPILLIAGRALKQLALFLFTLFGWQSQPVNAVYCIGKYATMLIVGPCLVGLVTIALMVAIYPKGAIGLQITAPVRKYQFRRYCILITGIFLVPILWIVLFAFGIIPSDPLAKLLVSAVIATVLTATITTVSIHNYKQKRVGLFRILRQEKIPSRGHTLRIRATSSSSNDM